MALIYFILSFLVLKVYPHGQMSSPRLRGCTTTYNPGTLQEYCPLWDDFGPNGVVGTKNGSPVKFGNDIVCRGQLREEPYVEVEAGQTLDLTYFLQAPHPGDCALYVSYDDDGVPDGEKQFALIWTKKDCLCLPENGGCSYFPAPNQGTCPKGCPQKRTITATIPEWLPSGVAVFHHNWFASHPRESGAVAGYPTVEVYSGCFDATVKNSNKDYTKLGITGMVTIPDVLPQQPLGFRANFERALPASKSFGNLAAYQMVTPATPTPKPTEKVTTPPTKRKIIHGNESLTPTQIIPDSSGKSVKPYIYPLISMVVLQIWSLNI